MSKIAVEVCETDKKSYISHPHKQLTAILAMAIVTIGFIKRDGYAYTYY
jgi:hypothetical protein